MTTPRERAQLQLALRQQQQALVRDLLPVLDALDRARDHWQQAQQLPPRPSNAPLRRLWRRLRRWWSGTPTQPRSPEAAAALARGAAEGIGLIRAQLLEVLQAHGLTAIECVGQPFDPQCMQALGQRPATPAIPAGLVAEEAVRGYCWHGILVRAAQVLVAAP
jgi:molecular chaperone GrpE